MPFLEIGLHQLKLRDVYDVAVKGTRVKLSASAKKRIERCHRYLLKKAQEGGTHYGINTGFGLLASVRIPQEDTRQLQVNLLRSHAVGMGPYLEDSAVRAMLLLRAQSLAQGHSGVSVKLVEQILSLLNKNICPLVPTQGSVGASGDLAPLSHLALVLIGEGKARVNGKTVSGKKALESARLKPIALGPKEGLALINGTQFMSALGVLTYLRAEHLCDLADAVSAMSLEALRGTATAFDPLIHSVRPHPGQILTAKRIHKFLRGGGRSSISKSHVDCGRVQDPYSLRCIPQVHGATRDVLNFVKESLTREINSVTDNPLIFPGKNKILSGGNFHGQIIAMSMDLLAIAMAEIGSISEQRIEKLINPAISDLPSFLTEGGGLNSGFMIVQVAAASIVSENKTLCHPACVDTIPTSADKEDHVSMGAWAAVKAKTVVDNVTRVLSMEMLSAAQGIDLLRPLKTTKMLEALHREIRKVSKKLTQDRSLHEELQILESLINNGSFKKYC